MKHATLIAVLATAALRAPLGTQTAAPSRETMRQYRLVPDGDRHRLSMTEVARPDPGPGEVLVRVRAVSLNHRDLYVINAKPRPDRPGVVPISDGAGQVVAVGQGVTQFRPGDRVAGTFFADWVDGRRTQRVNASARGGAIDGMLSEYVVSPENGLVKFPAHLSFEEAATLPCAALTAWVALFPQGRLAPGEFVLLEGTGGVSVFGLQLAVAARARPIITSSSDGKLERAKALGAVGTVNYRMEPEWQQPVRELTGGSGVAHVLEVGGEGTLPRALQALAYGGHVALIGGLTGFPDSMSLDRLGGLSGSVSSIYVGSRADFEAMNAFIEQHRIKPVIDKVFRFEDAPAAYEYLASGAHFGKIVITL